MPLGQCMLLAPASCKGFVRPVYATQRSCLCTALGEWGTLGRWGGQAHGQGVSGRGGAWILLFCPILILSYFTGTDLRRVIGLLGLTWAKREISQGVFQLLPTLHWMHAIKLLASLWYKIVKCCHVVGTWNGPSFSIGEHFSQAKALISCKSTNAPCMGVTSLNPYAHKKEGKLVMSIEEK